MLKTLIATVLVSFAAQAQMTNDGFDGLSFTGFSRDGETSESRNYSYRGEVAFSISKVGFSQRADARAFCTRNGKQLGHLEAVLMIAMSGASNFDKNLKAAVGENEGEIALWLPEAPEEVVKQAGGDIVILGSGFSSKVATLSEINKSRLENGGTAITLHAICVKNLK